MKLFGADADHEAMTGKEVLKRLELGYHVGLRQSSIRPDLRKILRELHEDAFTIMTICFIQRTVQRRTFIKKA